MNKDNSDTDKKVREFYNGFPFPGYGEFSSLPDFINKARVKRFLLMLEQQVPPGVRILDAGCGTGQLAVFLSIKNRMVTGIDISRNSIVKGREFKNRFDLKNVELMEMNIFNHTLERESYDYVFCNGVLHHTRNPEEGFKILCSLLKKNGYLVVGLYNRYGRLLTGLRKAIFCIAGERLMNLYYSMRRSEMAENKRRAWFMDQYRNPRETKHTIGEVLGWFRENGIEYINTFPKINLGQEFHPDEKLFDKHDAGTKADHFISQLIWIFTQAGGNGVFTVIGRKHS